MPFYQLFKFSTFHFMNQGIKALNLASGVYHSTSTGILSTKHSITNGFFHYDRSKVIYKEYNAF
jgi:hypothetical protein